MTLTDFHSAYFAHELTKRCSSDSIEKLAGALVDAQVDLNPHQVEAALFAFRSPLSRGAMLADEVGLGKTIEAGLVLSQKWAERKCKLLVIAPANLRKQWHQELSEKFFPPCRILEAKSYNEAIRRGSFQPFLPSPGAVVICSYQFARSKASDVANTVWDLVVIDEAHRLRNVYKPSNVIANILKNALARSPKLLLTATPLQNSLLELFGLVSFIDDHAFGDLKSFREQFANLSEDEVFQTLKARLAPICHRTLRRQVLEYVPFTKRHALVEEFTPAESEDRLYTEVSAYLQRDNLQALPSSQRSLMTLVLRKLLASSTFAIAGALDTLIARLKLKVGKRPEAKSLEEELDEDYEALDETAEEWGDDPADVEPLSEKDRTALEQEIRDLEAFRDLALTITQNAKGRALLTALDKAFAEAARLGAAKKAIIFTESRKTQDYLLRLLQDSPYSEGIVLFNGSNTDDRSKGIYTEWLRRNTGTDKVTGSRTADMRSALVDYFRDPGSIMIATEAGAEGINLQFCSLGVNYDLPWNPQRIEQRLGVRAVHGTARCAGAAGDPPPPLRISGGGSAFQRPPGPTRGLDHQTCPGAGRGDQPPPVGGNRPGSVRQVRSAQLPDPVLLRNRLQPFHSAAGGAAVVAHRPAPALPLRLLPLRGNDAGRALALMGKKLTAAQTLEGTFSSEGLVALAGEDATVEIALARSLVDRLDEGDTRRLWTRVLNPGEGRESLGVLSGTQLVTGEAPCADRPPWWEAFELEPQVIPVRQALRQPPRPGTRAAHGARRSQPSRETWLL